MKYVIDTNKKFYGAVYTSMRDGEHSDYGGETLQQLQERYPDCNFKVIGEEELNVLIDEYLKEASSEPFSEITEEQYWDMMDCLPPAAQGSNWFFVGEPFNFDIHLLCFTDGSRYFSGHRRITKIKEMKSEIKDFISNLKATA